MDEIPEAVEGSPSESTSPVSALWRVLLEPKATFEGIRERAPWVLPFALGLIVIVLFGYFTWPYQVDMRMEMMRLNENFPQEARDQALAQMQAARDEPVIWQVGLGAVVATIASLIGAGLWLMVGNVVLGGNASFKQIWSMFNYAGMVGIVELIIKWIMIVMKGSAEVFTSLALLGGALSPTSFAFRALDGVDIFSIWLFAVIGFGLAAYCRVATKKAMVASFVVWALWVFGFKAGLGSLIGGYIGM